MSMCAASCMWLPSDPSSHSLPFLHSPLSRHFLSSPSHRSPIPSSHPTTSYNLSTCVQSRALAGIEAWIVLETLNGHLHSLQRAAPILQLKVPEG